MPGASEYHPYPKPYLAGTRPYKVKDTDGYFLVVCASSDKECNDAATIEALTAQPFSK
jgi:hypothetical protein